MTPSRLQVCALSGCISLALAAPSYAAEADESTIVVSATGQESLLPAWTNSATKSAVPESKTPQVINTIGNKEIALRHAGSLNEILRYAPGVATEMRGNTSYMSEYKIRGFSVDQEYYNGLQLPYNVTGNTKARIDPLLVESVDILKGPASVLYGNGSPGGLVNIQGKKPQAEQRTEIGFNTGTRNLQEGYLDSTGKISDSDWNYRLLGKATAGDDQPHTTRYEDYLLAPSVSWQPDGKTRLTLDALAQNTPSLTPSNPLPIAWLRSGYAGRRDYAGDKWSGFSQRQWMVGYHFEHAFDSGWAFSQQARYFDVDSHQRSVYSTGNGANPNWMLDRFAYTTDEDLKSVNVDNQLSKTLRFGEWQHHLLAGFDWQKLDSHFYYRYASVTPGINMRDPDYHQIHTDDLGLYTAQKNRLSYQQNGYYLQDQMAFGGFNLLASIRYDDYCSTTTDAMRDGEKTWISQDRVTKRLGALYAFENGLSPFISYAEGFKPISPQGSLTAKDVKPTTSKQVEGGVKYLLADYATTFTASLFNIRQKNVLSATPTWDYRQTGEIESKGAELSVISRPADNVTLIANYAWTHAINTEDETYEGKRPTQVPENAFNLWGDYTFDSTALRGLTLGAGARYSGPMEISPDNKGGRLGGTTQYDLAMTWRAGELLPALNGVTLKASAQNITNKETFSCYDSTNCWIGRDRTVQVGASYSF
ncbi:TonB-dependent siderophore receptor [Citrobacter rodentium NBRC 105723 = DSM 16636]|uniref:TonB-dependent siderophore receptor n=1 Tax=Citrobacter rodentium TaxID=67825 RepID=A0A482PV33_CITRO|nr:TonB-dependent siderophore receptor [Citrobacter rodentium]KIQ50778.1 TonB-dependent receptor [Citrobacter rodentium]QBY31972.1 TonB-dependent siderophore receptor [Citrobacter rodentium]UHO33536.1 TonB-dependent siderophore receptor [Citrobacter rodentium NBRC 105723 = DSM 16636]HAT8012716.1 TonB-dependent siderophore receptor [Citrobacter rodentium NBRC 105723 = DSM 16636]HAT8016724.1 TonB-dependent siderophore receptor [Citrobacter rodentium]